MACPPMVVSGDAVTVRPHARPGLTHGICLRVADVYIVRDWSVMALTGVDMRSLRWCTVWVDPVLVSVRPSTLAGNSVDGRPNLRAPASVRR
jgi:hypothetical protein